MNEDSQKIYNIGLLLKTAMKGGLLSRIEGQKAAFFCKKRDENFTNL